MRRLRLAVIAGIALCGAVLVLGTASAMPVGGLANASEEVVADFQRVVWVCGPVRCWWRPNVWGGPRVYARPWGWRARPYWRRW